ncbi:MAG: pentapeptide repeat-containing protein [Verrucomicrobiota bacterium]
MPFDENLVTLLTMWDITAEELAAHAEWLSSGGARGKRLDKTGRDLSSKNYPKLQANQAHFIGTNFTDANLKEASMIMVDCSGARFERTNLYGADLRSADLGGVILDGVNLAMADLSGADLSGASLKGANLTRTNFTDADLIGADLTGATQDGICVQGAMLSDTKGLTAKKAP